MCEGGKVSPRGSKESKGALWGLENIQGDLRSAGGPITPIRVKEGSKSV